MSPKKANPKANPIETDIQKNKKEKRNKYTLNHGFVQLPFQLIYDLGKDCGPEAGFLFVCLLSHRNNSTHLCYPSINLLSKESGLSITSTKKYIKLLENHGYISHKIGGTETSENFDVKTRSNFYNFDCINFFSMSSKKDVQKKGANSSTSKAQKSKNDQKNIQQFYDNDDNKPF